MKPRIVGDLDIHAYGVTEIAMHGPLKRAETLTLADGWVTGGRAKRDAGCEGYVERNGESAH